MQVLLGGTPHLSRFHYESIERQGDDFDAAQVTDLKDAIYRVIKNPTVASKSFLITIGDRSITGMVARDQLVGPWQVPVADAAVTTTSLQGFTGEAMAMGERPPVALSKPCSICAFGSGRDLFPRSCQPKLTRLATLNYLQTGWQQQVKKVKTKPLFEGVKAIGMEMCPALGIAIPVGKDSLSMRTTWNDEGVDKSVTSPMSGVITAFAPVTDVRKTLTPELKNTDSVLVRIDLSKGQFRLGGSILAQVYKAIGSVTPDVDNFDEFKAFFALVQDWNNRGLIQAYHDIGDGGLLATVTEMMFASRLGVALEDQSVAALFAEEIGAVLQISKADWANLATEVAASTLKDAISVVGTVNNTDQLAVNGLVLERADLQAAWSEVSHQIQRLRDNFRNC